MPKRDTFDLLSHAAEDGRWNDASQIVVLCHFLDQLRDNIRNNGGADMYEEFAVYLGDQLEQERDALDSKLLFETVKLPEFTDGIPDPELEGDDDK